jgi:hypothetical protein
VETARGAVRGPDHGRFRVKVAFRLRIVLDVGLGSCEFVAAV